MDARLNPETPASPEHVATFRKDYRPPDWLVPSIELDIDLDPTHTVVRCQINVELRDQVRDRPPLKLNGDGIKPSYVRVIGQSEEETQWRMDGDALEIVIDSD